MMRRSRDRGSEPRTESAAAAKGIMVAGSTLLLAMLLSTQVAARGDDGSSDASGAAAVSSAAAPPDPGLIVEERVQVLGSAELAAQTPGSAHYIDKETLQEQGYGDIHRVLQQLPGINIQEEEGFGLRPNIGLRGTGVERSQKITLMEDGVLIAPAPYTAPAAYYFPTAARMEGVEVQKGSSAIRQGPYTNGGALNLISTSLPSRFAASVDAAAGEHSTGRLHAAVGNRGERFGWLAETFQLGTDGFKELDGGGETGVELQDYLVKLHVSSRSDASLSQLLELKLGKTEQFGNETYLGLTDQDFELTPLRRYAASRLDNIDTDHEQVQLRYFVMPSSRIDLSATLYDNDFFRDWFKNERVAGTSNASVLADPELYPREIAILRGDLDSGPGELTLRHNRREYYSRGLQSILGWDVGGAHQLELGLRLHQDQEDRFQNDELYQMLGGDLELTEVLPPGSQTNRVAEAETIAFYLQDQIALGRFSLTPGIRYESIDYVRRDYSRQDPTRSAGPTRVRENGVDVWIPGLGIAYELGGSQRLFLGVHRGFSPPGAGVNEETREEESLNFELGYRRFAGRLGSEVTLFRSDYDNLLGLETVSGGGSTAGELFNGGAVLVEGIEAMLSYQLTRPGSAISVPLRLTYTYTDSEFRSSFVTSFADWAPAVEVGDELPYLPPHQLSATVGVVGRRAGLHLATSWVDEMRTRAGQGPIPQGEGTDERFIVDLSADYRVLQRLRVYGQLRNVGDVEYLVARRPYGGRPGMPRTFLAGIEIDF